MLQLGLEADDVVERAERVVLAQLDDGVGAVAGALVGEADRLHRAVAQRVDATRRHHLDRQAALEIGRRALPFFEVGLVAVEQRLDERDVLLLAERAVDVVGVAAAGTLLVIARLEPRLVHVDRLAMDDRRDGVEEGQRVLVRELPDGVGERRRGEGAGRDDDVIPVGGRQAGNLAAAYFNAGMLVERPGHGG